MRPRLAALVALGSLACGGGQGSKPPAPQSPQQTLAQFMAAVKANDADRMGALWGSERGPAKASMKPEELHQRVAAIQKYLDHVGYRVLDGPRAMAGKDNVETFRIELQRRSCTVAFPIDLVRTKSGGWLVLDVHLADAGTPGAPCKQ